MRSSAAAIDAEQALAQLATALQPLVAATPDCVMIGIHTGGVWVAERLHARFALGTPLGRLNISFYRDDFTRIGLHPSVGPSQIEQDLDERTVLLIDDVLHTGRTVRAALNELFDYGRPAAVRLGVLIDRGARELPFAPDAVGTRIDLDAAARIKLTGPEPLALEVR
ncbi:MAG TPA: bifunctional pyr operon transcriptional regulator/uracil phosphoribosyltransferase PyrR [Salinisphaeraceae bacterium]|nr:bifunctional pyr operon transcriptional regulator/uracil phosphoribosyltransferase PyrR [Salinisphaeraceae bacterium]